MLVPPVSPRWLLLLAAACGWFAASSVEAWGQNSPPRGNPPSRYARRYNGQQAGQQGGSPQQPVVRQARRDGRQPAAPFQLTPQQRAQVDTILELWEKESDKIRSYKCPFERWEYDPVFGPGMDIPKTKSDGQLTYMKPDKGSFRIYNVRHYVPPQEPGEQAKWVEKEGEPGEHWVCDGEAVYEYVTPKKQLVVRELPEEMRGKAIADGPLPFLFGAEKEKLKRRYFVRVTRATETEIWLDVFPRHQQDAANYRRVELILDREEFLPAAVQIYLPNDKSRTVYIFKLEEASVNSTVDSLLQFFVQPRTPLGWKKVYQKAPPVDGNAARRRQPLRR